MLTCLRVRSFAIIDELEVELDHGLNVVTGETGAGKSILVDALGLVLGARGRPEVVRTGETQAEVEAMFDLAAHPELRERLAAQGLSDGDELVVRRVISAAGRTRAYVNGRLTTAGQLQALAAGMVDISSQHQHHTLADPATHLAVLDAFAGLTAARAEMARAHAAVADAAAALAEIERQARDRFEREDLLRYQVREIEELDPQPGEEEELGLERERLRHAERLAFVAGGAEETLYAADDALCSALARLAAELQDAARIDATLEGPARVIDSAATELAEAARDLGRYASDVSVDPERLAEVEERLARLSRLRRKYGGSLDEARAHRDRAVMELDALDRHEEREAASKKALQAALDAASSLALGLRDKRRKAARKLGRSVGEELRSLGMGDAEVRVELAPLEGGAGELAVAGARLTPSGIDRAELLIAPNRGEEPRPLRRIASGGELSRAMLAIKRVLGGVSPGGLYVFDEVDAGVGGAVAEVLGQKLRDVARHHQVLCITHLPQIAVYADAHFRVHKGVDGGRTRSEVRRLADAERVEEVARMLGGLSITARTRAAARDLLSGARG